MLKEAINDYGKPKPILTDRGTQFYASAGKKAKGVSQFEKFLAKNGIRHTVGRVNHPQTIGNFDTVDEFIEWYS